MMIRMTEPSMSNYVPSVKERLIKTIIVKFSKKLSQIRLRRFPAPRAWRKKRAAPGRAAQFNREASKGWDEDPLT
jgi:hypothetical protein